MRLNDGGGLDAGGVLMQDTVFGHHGLVWDISRRMASTTPRGGTAGYGVAAEARLAPFFEHELDGDTQRGRQVVGMEIG